MNVTNFTEVLTSLVNNDKGLFFIGGSEDKFVSYKDLLSRSKSTLGFFQRISTKPRELVLQLESHESFVTAFLACILGGYIAVPLATGNETDCQKKLASIWAHLNDPHLLIDKKNLERLNKYCQENGQLDLLQQINERISLEADLLGSGLEGTVRTAVPSDIAFVQYSSGSTGKPKGSVVLHSNLVANTLDIIERGQISKADQSISWLPLSHDFGLICVFLTNVMAGINQFMIPTNLFIRKPLTWLHKVTEYKISLMYSPNFGLQYVLANLSSNTQSLDLSSVRLLYNGSEPIIDELCNTFVTTLSSYGFRKQAMYTVYGLAEATVGVSFPEMTDTYEAISIDRRHLNVGNSIAQLSKGDINAITIVAVGRPLKHCKVRVASTDSIALPERTIGHIELQGDNLVRGYYKESALSAELYTQDDWLKTGDIGFLKDGKVFITGRHKNLIIVNGQNYYPHDIEALVAEIPSLQLGDLIACGIPQADNLNDDLVIFIVSKAATVADDVQRDIRKAVFRNFGLTTKHIVAIRKAPKTTSGKIQYFKLRELFLNGELNTEIHEIVVRPLVNNKK